jgi:hypothetical protein
VACARLIAETCTNLTWRITGAMACQVATKLDKVRWPVLALVGLAALLAPPSSGQQSAAPGAAPPPLMAEQPQYRYTKLLQSSQTNPAMEK